MYIRNAVALPQANYYTYTHCFERGLSRALSFNNTFSKVTHCDTARDWTTRIWNNMNHFTFFYTVNAKKTHHACAFLIIRLIFLAKGVILNRYTYIDCFWLSSSQNRRLLPSPRHAHIIIPYLHISMSAHWLMARHRLVLSEKQLYDACARRGSPAAAAGVSQQQQQQHIISAPARMTLLTAVSSSRSIVAACSRASSPRRRVACVRKARFYTLTVPVSTAHTTHTPTSCTLLHI